MTARFLSIPANHPALAGHFPGNPVTPGALLLDAVLREAQERGFRATGLHRAKFTAPLRPDTPFRILLSRCVAGLTFQVLTDHGSVAQGTLACTAGDPAEDE